MRFTTIVAALFVVLLPRIGAAQTELDRIVSRVNNKIITQSDIREAMLLKLVEDAATEDSTRRGLENRMLILAEIARLPPLPPASENELATRRSEWEGAVGGRSKVSDLIGRTTLNDGSLDGWLRDDVRIQMQLKRQFGNLADADRTKATNDWIARLRQRAGLNERGRAVLARGCLAPDARRLRRHLRLAIWHISLLWLYHDTPAVLGAWLTATFLFTVVARALARRVPPDDRSALMRACARLDRTGFVFVAFFLVLLLSFHLSFQRAASDGRSYFVQVRSLVMDWDLKLANDEASFGGQGADKYAFGAPVLWSPVYVLGHLYLRGLNLLGGHWPTDGYTYPYQRAVGLATLLYGFVGLVLIYRMLRRYFSQSISALSTLGICAMTFLVWYMTADNSMVHGASMFATTLFLFLWHRFRDRPTPRRWMWLGASAGLMGYVRWQDGLFAVVPLVDFLWASWRARTGAAASRFRAAAGDLARFAAAALVVFSPQLLFWKAAYGQVVHLPTQEHGFHPSLNPPYLIDVLFSSNRGLLTTTPVVTLAIIGLVPFTRRHWRVGLALAAGLLAQMWVNGAVEIWWGGAGYGARRFANSMVVFAVGLASLLSTMQRFPLVAPVMMLSGLLVYNVAYMAGFKDGGLPTTEGVTFSAVVNYMYERVGNPFSLPVGAYFSWRYDVPIAAYDRLRGRTYNNITVNVGTPDDERFLGGGWSAREQSGQERFRWTNAASSTVLAPLITNVDDYLLELEWAAFEAPGLPPQIVGIDINDVALPAVQLQAGMHTDRVRIPARLLRPQLNILRFRYAYAKSPKELGLSGDERRLAVRCTTIRLLRQLRSTGQQP